MRAAFPGQFILLKWTVSIILGGVLITKFLIIKFLRSVVQSEFRFLRRKKKLIQGYCSFRETEGTLEAFTRSIVAL
jgi:hypothetical protein